MNEQIAFANLLMWHFQSTCDIMSEAVQKLLTSAKVAIFSKTYCPYCVKVGLAVSCVADDSAVVTMKTTTSY